MTGKLAIFSPRIGVRSETFIKRHIDQLNHKEPVVLTRNILSPEEGTWSVKCPVYRIRESTNLLVRGVRFVGRRLGIDGAEYLDVDGIKRFLEQQDVETILGQYLTASWPFIKIAREMGIRFFAHAHGFDLSRSFLDPVWRRRYADYKNAAGVIVVNRVMQERLISVGVPPGKIHIVIYGVDVPEVPVNKVTTDKVRCVAVGGMVGKKAPLKLLESFLLALKQLPNLHLDFVGDGPLYNHAQRFVERNDLQPYVTLHGGQPHQVVLDLMRNADIFLQHSMVDPKTGDEEGSPVAILEAMAHSLPVISTRHAGIPESVTEGRTGYLVDEGNVERMANHIVVLARDAELRHTMGVQGWSIAHQKFTWQREVSELARIMGLPYES